MEWKVSQNNPANIWCDVPIDDHGGEWRTTITSTVDGYTFVIAHPGGRRSTEVGVGVD